MGDGALVEFGSVVDAVTCAVAVQKDRAARQKSIPADRRIVFDFGRAKTELDVVLRLNPCSVGILTYYLSWASAFGEPAWERSWRTALSGSTPTTSRGPAHLCAMPISWRGATRMRSKGMESDFRQLQQICLGRTAPSLAVLGRKAEAQATIKEALLRHPKPHHR
jgi:hypothetical protein